MTDSVRQGKLAVERQRNVFKLSCYPHQISFPLKKLGLPRCFHFVQAFLPLATNKAFQPEEFVRCSAATGETFGTMTFIFAAEINPVLTAPITSFHCLITIVLARIFLKERFSKKQYISLGFVVLGIVILAFADIFGL